MRPWTPAPDRGTCHELRVHGVAGSPPESMLQLGPVLVGLKPGRRGALSEDPEITEWEQPTPRPQLRAWSWSSLTSGRWYQAFYLLLLPFMLANLAGWMLVPLQRDAELADPAAARSPRVRSAVLAVRLVGLLVTLVVVLWAQLVVSDLVTYQWLVRVLGWQAWTIGGGTAATAALLLAVVGLTRIRPRRGVAARRAWSRWSDPVGYAFLHRQQHPMWNSPAINVALRRLHLSAGLAVVALVAAWPAGELAQPWRQLGWVALGLATGGLTLVVVLLAWVSLANGRPPEGFGERRWDEERRGDEQTHRGRGMPPVELVRWGSWLAPALAVGLAAVSSAGTTSRWVQDHATLPALRGGGAWATVAVLVGVALVAVCSLVRTEASPRQRANTPSVLLLAVAVVAALGAGVAEQVGQVLQGQCPAGRSCMTVGEHVDWLAVAFVTVLAVVVIVVAGRWVALSYAADRPHPGWRVAARDLTERGSWLTALLGVPGASAAVAAMAWIGLRGTLPPVDVIPTGFTATVVIVLVTPVVVGAAVRVWKWKWWPLGPMLLAVLVAGAATAVVAGWSVPVLGIAVPPITFRDFARTVAIVVPTGALLRRIYTGLRNQDVRRGSGVLWDVGTFWPRWFHPFAPPTYSDRAVTHLTDRIEEPFAPDEDALLVAAHSQGTVIAGAAVLGARPSERVALLTFGSPWHHLYAEFFPAYFCPAATAALADRLSGRWRNLFRVTDPVGGPIRSDVDATPLADPCHRVHSDYWLEDAYHVEAQRLSAMICDDDGVAPARNLISAPRRP